MVGVHIDDEEKDGCGVCCYSRDYGDYGTDVLSQDTEGYACLDQRSHDSDD